MEHVVQFGINIDDEAIRDGMIDAAQKQIFQELKKELGLEGSNSWTRDRKIQCMVQEQIDKHFDQWKPEIIEITSDKLVEKIFRTKMFKESIESALNCSNNKEEQ